MTDPTTGPDNRRSTPSETPPGTALSDGLVSPSHPVDARADAPPDTTAADEDQARDSLEKVFEALNVAQVVYVDDWFELQQQDDADAVEKIVGWFRALVDGGREGECVSLLPDLPFDADVQVWRPAVKRHWEGLGAGDKRKLQKRLILLLDLGDYDSDEGAVSVLRSVLPSSMPDPLEIGPKDWERAEPILRGAEPAARVLCLLDRNFEYSYGFDSPRDGVALLKEVVGEYDADSVIFGLFSHTFEQHDELPKWRELVEHHEELDQDNFLPLSKTRQDDIVLLAKGLEMMSLNLPCSAMKRMTLRALSDAHETAASEVRGLEVYDFDEMVLRSSLKEGVWEGDTLLRLYQVFHRDAARRKLLETDADAEAFYSAVENARAISAYKVGMERHPPNQRWKIRHQELYQEGAILNPQHVPLRTGDIFEDPAGRVYVLIAQPCDLMVRAESPGSGERGAAVVVVAPVRPMPKLEWEGMDVERKQVRAVLPYISEASDDVGVVLLGQAAFVHPDVLDLAVFDSEGRCALDLTGDSEPAAQLSLAWQKRYSKVLRGFQKHRRRLDELSTTLDGVRDAGPKQKAWEAMMPTFSLGKTSPLAKVPYSDGVFDFGLRRTAHFREPGASRLLATYSRFLSRDALPHDFALGA